MIGVGGMSRENVVRGIMIPNRNMENTRIRIHGLNMAEMDSEVPGNPNFNSEVALLRARRVNIKIRCIASAWRGPGFGGDENMSATRQNRIMNNGGATSEI